MTDKQIIIDGVDVSACIYYKATGRYNTCGYYCEQNPNCYYKNWKRKEQECKRLKEDEKSLLNVIDDLQKTKNTWEEKYNDLGQDFDQLKGENNALFKAIEEVNKINKRLEVKNEELKKVSCKFKDYCTCDTEKLKQTLTEIKEIAEDVYHAGIQISCAEGLKQILQKINEVEDDN